MSYLDKNLLKDETVIFRPDLHWEPFITPTLLLFIVVSLYLFGPWWVGIINFFLGIKIFLGFLGAIIFMRTTEYAITSNRVFSKTGLFTTVSSDMMLEKIESAIVIQPFLGKFLNYGHVAFSGDGGKDLMIVIISDPYGFKKQAYR